MPRPRRPRTPLRHFLTLLWQQPLLAVPFALFFGTIYGDGQWRPYLEAYALALIMAFTISLCLWITEHLVMPRLRRHAPAGAGRVPVAEGLVYAAASIGGSYVGAVIIRMTIFPGFMGGARGFFIFTMYTLLFAVLFSAISYAIIYYRQSLERVRSEQELNLARRIQRSFLLSQFPEMPRLEIHAVNISSKQVSGDFYDVVPAIDDSLLLAVADVSGKGVPAALLTSMLQASLRTQAATVRSVATILENVNQLVYQLPRSSVVSSGGSTAVQQFATFFLARVEERTLRLSYSNAGHNFPIVYRTTGERVTLERGGTVIGSFEHTEFEEGTVELRPGDRMLLYTDGISEAALESGEMFGEERIHAAIEALPASLTAREIVEHLLESVRGFLHGVEAGDDMTIMVLRVLEDGAGPRHG